MRGLLSIAAAILAMPAHASTFSVDFRAKASLIIATPSNLTAFSADAPFDVGDTLSVSAVFTRTPTAPSTINGYTLYQDALVSLSGSIGGYTFAEEQPSNFTLVRGEEYPDIVGDRIFSQHGIDGNDIAGWQPADFIYTVFEFTENLLPDDSFGPSLFAPELLQGLTPPLDSADLILTFQRPGFGSVQVNADLLVATHVAPVPLPASAWLLMIGVAGLLARRRNSSTKVYYDTPCTLRRRSLPLAIRGGGEPGPGVPTKGIVEL